MAAIRFWIMPLDTSLYCDEAGSWWTVQGGLGEMWQRYLEFPSTPPAYAVLFWGATKLGGMNEVAMRFPSLVGIAVASFLLYRLARRLLGEDAALPTVAAFVGSRWIILASIDARPYAVLLTLIVGSTLALVAWFDSGGARRAAVYAVSAGLIPWFHYLAMPVVGVHLVYAVVRLRGTTPVRWRAFLWGAVATLVVALPVAPALLHMIASRGTHVFAPAPTVRDLAEFLAPSVTVFAIGFGVFVAWVVCRRVTLAAARVGRADMVLILALALLPTLAAFGVSVASSTKIFVERYMIGAVVGLSLLFGWAVGRIQPASARAIVVASLVVSSIGAFGYVRRPLHPPHMDHDWRGAMAAVRRLEAEAREPLRVLYKCPFIECTAELLNSGRAVPGWAVSPLLLYPPNGPIAPVVFEFDEGAGLYMEARYGAELERQGRFVLVTSNQDEAFDRWLGARFGAWRMRSLGSFGIVKAIVFERAGA